MPSSRTSSTRSKEDADRAAVEALRGAGWGAVKYGLPLALLSLSLHAAPQLASLPAPRLYRALTVQFKVFLQLSGMTLGGWIEADRRLRAYERDVRGVRMRNGVRRDEEVWKRWEGLVEEEEAAKLTNELERERRGR